MSEMSAEDARSQWRRFKDLYQKEKEKNREFISKDKIKAIIKDLGEFDEDFYDNKILKLAFKNSLQELLKEEE